MNYKKFLGVASAALMIVIVIVLILAPAAWAQSKYKTVYKFTGGKDGSQPYDGLIFDGAGNLYGTTQYGGAHNLGIVFKLTPAANGNWTESVLHNFSGSDGATPQAGLIFDAAGNLYGTTDSGADYGGGTVFKLAPNSDGSWTESELHRFCSLTNCEDGQGSFAGLIFDAAGNLYGTTWNGGSTNHGVVFKLAPTSGGWNESVLYSFGPDGQNSDAGLVFDSAGVLYGVTWYGGTYGAGVVFKLIPTSSGEWKESALHRFSGGNDGARPRAGLTFDSAGNLYGTTGGGGAYGRGVAFSLTPNTDGSWTQHTLHQFTGGKDGGSPGYTSLIFDKSGNLYGTTMSGGAFGFGVVFKLVPTSNGGWSFHVLHAFQDRPGAQPIGGLIFDGAGNLYGTTAGNGNTFGSVFEITP